MSNRIVSNRDRLSRQHYLLLANSPGYWFNVSPGRLRQYRNQYGDDFCVVLYRDGPEEDAYVLPFFRIGQLFTEQNLRPASGNSMRWVGDIKADRLYIRNTTETVEVSGFHNALHLLELDEHAAVHYEFRQTPTTFDIAESSLPERAKQETCRILRDTSLAREVKAANHYKCQICGMTLVLKGNRPYAEAHHIKPLGAPHNGPDERENIICVCPNHHVLLDYGAIELDASQLDGVSEEYVEYHNTCIFGNAQKGAA